ncbi:hypothetical protein HBI78_118330 [Parastagonospora nodorum]|nr:hypothetical protein HBI78_118330 [Parastagonospora nodorum]
MGAYRIFCFSPNLVRFFLPVIFSPCFSANGVGHGSGSASVDVTVKSPTPGICTRDPPAGKFVPRRRVLRPGTTRSKICA